ncbi:DNA polymerase-3 subunit gamma/tau [Haloactinospora alba]|uniref:DNA polymerase III subunit gamma/tau n=1 Tax=Haloactinospora alba TaxID=405555 RepID=A0A543N9S9_9ACTN|nr:DNA polymerase III subunit gamma and tau [Haloactinospora alba]TQN28550.1 DNA polymerase-3 subunit gamma/tau [Haloactinospora alba]
MNIALYRKYRPGTFAEVRGQEHVTEPLRQALRNGRINHAYMFSGPRGCGKTSSARILARSLNCEHGPTPDPCGECEPCAALAPDGPGSIDVIEIDAASHGGVDDARDLRERAFFAPVNSRYKIYVVDEAHMVTREGFNALLKLVEEPPPHLKFVFATTEPDKVVTTIRSRTHHYPFRLIPPATLRGLMEEILTEEGVSFDPAALPLVVRAGAGSARDSLSILDQLLAGSDENGISREGAVALLGYTDATLLSEMVDALGAGDGAAAFGLVDRVIESGTDPRRFTADLLERVRDLVVLAAVPDALDKGLINVTPDAVEPMKEQASRIGSAQLTRAAEILNTGLTEMRGATSPRLLLELLCARVLLPGVDSSGGGAVLARLDRLEQRVESGGGTAPAASAPAPSAPAPPAAAPPAPPAPEARPASGEEAPESPQPQRPETADAGRTQPESAPAREPSAPGAGGRQSAPEAPARPPAPAGAAPASGDASGGGSGGGGDSAAVQNAWPRILESVKQRRKATWMILNGYDVQILGVEGSTLQLGFTRPNDAKGFSNSGSDKVVEAAITEVLGVSLRVSPVPANRTSSTPQRSGNGGAEQAPAPSQDSQPPSREPAGWEEPAAAPAPSQPAAAAASQPAEPAPPEPEPAAPAPPEPEPEPEPDLSEPEPPEPEPPEPDPGPEPEPDAEPPAPKPPAPKLAAPEAPASGPRNGSAPAVPPGSGSRLIESELGGKVIDEIDHTGS